MSMTRIFFGASAPANTQSLWSTEGTAIGTMAVGSSSYSPVFEPSAVTNFAPFGNKIFYLDDMGNAYLSDGTSFGTFTVNGAGGSWSYLEKVGSVFYYFAGGSLWSSDGKNATQLASIPTEYADPQFTYAKDASGKGWVFFIVFDGTSNQLWKTDGVAANTAKVADLAGSGSVTDLTAFNGSLLFVFNGKLWTSD